ISPAEIPRTGAHSRRAGGPAAWRSDSVTKAPEEHAHNWDLRHEDFQDNDFLYYVYSVMRRNAPFAHTDTPFLSATPGGAWVATRYTECYRILQQHRSPDSHTPWTAQPGSDHTGCAENALFAPSRWSF